MLKVVLFAQCVRIPVLKIEMPHVHKSLTSGVILNKSSSFSSHEVSWRSRYGGQVTTVPKMKYCKMSAVFSTFSAKSKIA